MYQGLYAFSHQRFKDFSRTFQDPTLNFQGLLYTNLATTKQNVWVESYVLGINTCTYRNARQRELENTCKPDICSALVVQWTCARVTREHWEQKTSVFTHSASILKILNTVYQNICFHWLSFTLKLTSIDIFPILLNKRSRTFKYQTNFLKFRAFQDAFKP